MTKHTMRLTHRLCFLSSILLITVQVKAAIVHHPEIRSLLFKLDTAISHKDHFVALKNSKIEQIRIKEKGVRSPDERYWINRMFYDEYYVFNSDSALYYADQNLGLAKKMNNKEGIAAWAINKSFVLSASGLLKEALDVLDEVSAQELDSTMRTDYYGQMVYLYSHFRQYSGESDIKDTYRAYEEVYRDSIFATITPDNPMYLWYQGWRSLNSPNAYEVIHELEKIVSADKLDSRQDAMNAYVLAILYMNQGNQEGFLKYMIYSAIADVKTANKDIASLEELAKALYTLGDIDRAYTYINYCLQDAQLYRNRVRVVSIAAVQDEVHKAFQVRNLRQEERLHFFLVIVSILSVILIAALLYIYRQMKRLSKSRADLDEANQSLNLHIKELSIANEQLEEAHTKLQSLNEQLQDANSQLRESNYVKEEYIGYVFAICSNYISKLDEYRKNINRKVKAKQFDDIKTLTDTPTMAQNELKEFYHNFDAIFLHVYPTFLDDFNALLHPGERIVLKEGELLTTELRIYALVRLGINDSVKIAEFLHCSPQTVYNNRLKTRNKAIIPKESFAEAVKSLGKMK